MAVIAASIAGAAAVVGGGLSYAGARKQAKAATAANKRNIAAAKDANYAEQINEAMRRGTPGIYPGMPRAEYNSVMQDLPAAVAFAQYADEATGEKGFEKNVFADMVTKFNETKDFWNQFQGRQDKDMKFFESLPEVQEQVARKSFAENAAMTQAQAADMANLARQQGDLQGDLLRAQLGGENIRTLADTYRGFGGVGGGAPMNNSLLNNMMRYSPAAAQAHLQGEARALGLEQAAERAANPWTSGLEQQILGGQQQAIADSQRFRTAALGQKYAPETSFINASRPFQPGTAKSPDQVIPHYAPDQSGKALSALGGALTSTAGQIGGAMLTAGMFGAGGGGGGASLVPGYGSVSAPPAGGFPAADPFSGTWAGQRFG